MLEVQAVQSGYGRLTVLHDFSITVRSGTVVGVLGANGAGKTTALKTVMGLLRTSSGSIKFLGERIDNARCDEIVRRGITLVPQGRELFPWMTVHENLEIAGLSQSDPARTKRLCEEQFETFPHLRNRAMQRAQSLSGGEQQMLALARALMLEPKLILMDEPTTGLAPKVVLELGKVIKELAWKGRTIVLVEQNLGLVSSVAEYVYVIRNGRNVFEGSVETLKSDKDIHQYYLT